MKTIRVSEVLATDFLVLGGGVAGLRAAIALAPHGRVTVLTKDRPQEGATEYAQGGVAVALSDEDEIGFHLEDTLKAGAGLCDQDAVHVLVEEGPQRIRELMEWGAAFDREAGQLLFAREGAHSHARIVRSRGDSTGQEIQRALLAKAQGFSGIRRIAFACTIDLLVQDGVCCGALFLHEPEGRVVAVAARAAILATGGAGQVYLRTSNPPVATGDGMAIAYRAGATLEDMEFVQFHPTCLYYTGAPQFLLTEGMRGEGGILRNIHGETFMARYDPRKELAPRDVVSRAIWAEMAATHSSKVFLDMTHLDAAFLKRRFPRIYATCLRYALDITEDWIPVCPAAHYMMGGVRTDIYGTTDLPGLFAAGEVACTRVHGANRLASNSLLEGLVFGARVGEAALAYARREPTTEPPPLPDLGPMGKRDVLLEKVRTDLRKSMWNNVGIVRSRESLEQALQDLEAWEPHAVLSYPHRRGQELRNLLCVSKLIASAALEREGSVGAHYRSDFPEPGKDWQQHIALSGESPEAVSGPPGGSWPEP